MKNRIIALLLGIIIGSIIWAFSEFEKKNNIHSENINIQTRIKNIEYKKKQKQVNQIKEDILSKINSDKETYNIKNEISIEIDVYNYIDVYKKIYTIVTNDKQVDEKIGYKQFKKTILFKRLNDLKEGTLHTHIKYNDGKEKDFDYLPINIDCPDNFFCKKIINKEINEVYNLDKDILNIKNEKDIDINKEIVIDILMSNKTLYEYFNN